MARKSLFNRRRHRVLRPSVPRTETVSALAVLIALAFLGIVLYYVVVALEKIFAGWAERQPT